ncbi:hypothetical protein G6F37_011396 [Rhizopus arrhizus]|nr:hypothetical protein G6F38_011582 [Rhizopus arrhizus]KAG1149551.1 hypothetical protein G6F37_011396 [Rhizopus arrhizus]
MATIETAYYVPTFSGLSTTFGISCAISVACVLGFEIHKRLESMQCLFAPRTRLTKNSSIEQNKRIFSWLLSTMSVDEHDLIQKVGLDATMHIRFLRMAVHFLTPLSLFVCPVLLGLHWIGHSHEQTVYLDHFRSNSTLYSLSIANIPSHSPVVWTHVFFTWFISLTWLWLLFVNHLHHTYLLQQQSSTSTHKRSILVTHVPPSLRNKEALREHFAKLGQIESVNVIPYKTIHLLEKLLDKRKKAIDKLEVLLIKMVQKIEIATNDEEDWNQWLNRLQEQSGYEIIYDIVIDIKSMDKEICRLREKDDQEDVTASAFITFNSNQSAQTCAQVVTSWKPGILNTTMAPEPRDVLWRHLLRKGRKDRILGGCRQWVVFAAVWSLTIFWLFPITFILGLTSIQSLSQHFPFLNNFIASSLLIRTFIQNILPTLLVTLFMSFLPSILLELSKLQDFISYSELEDAVLGRHYHFAIFNVLIVFLLGTTFLNTMFDVLYEPAMLIQLLAYALPQGANFFLNYVLFNLSTHAMELMLLGSQYFGHLLLTLPFFSRTPRMRLHYTAPWSFPYYYYYPAHILVLVIALTYSVIQPLILIVALFYFTVAVAVYRHQYLYCYIRKYESSGCRHYGRMTRYTSDGLLIFQLTVVGILYLKSVLTAATAVLPLIIFTIWTKVKLNHLFRQRTKYSPSIFDLPTTNWGQTNWWLDDIWKLSLIKSWYQSGRYGRPEQEERNDSTSEVTTVAAAKQTQEKEKVSLVHVQCHYARAEYVVMHDLKRYPDDSSSVFESYQHPVFHQPLDTHLILPRHPKPSSFWNINECVLVPLERLNKFCHV